MKPTFWWGRPVKCLFSVPFHENEKMVIVSGREENVQHKKIKKIVTEKNILQLKRKDFCVEAKCTVYGEKKGESIILIMIMPLRAQ